MGAVKFLIFIEILEICFLQGERVVKFRVEYCRTLMLFTFKKWTPKLQRKIQFRFASNCKKKFVKKVTVYT